MAPLGMILIRLTKSYTVSRYLATAGLLTELSPIPLPPRRHDTFAGTFEPKAREETKGANEGGGRGGENG